jgi:hypothetical protein
MMRYVQNGYTLPCSADLFRREQHANGIATQT